MEEGQKGPQSTTPSPNVPPRGGNTDSDAQNNKMWGILAYIFFLIPWLFAKDSKFARYHTNQGLVLFLAEIIIWIAGSVIPAIGPLIIVPIGNIAIIILVIIGIMNAAKGVMKPLPLIGGITILKD